MSIDYKKFFPPIIDARHTNGEICGLACPWSVGDDCKFFSAHVSPNRTKVNIGSWLRPNYRFLRIKECLAVPQGEVGPCRLCVDGIVEFQGFSGGGRSYSTGINYNVAGAQLYHPVVAKVGDDYKVVCRNCGRVLKDSDVLDYIECLRYFAQEQRAARETEDKKAAEEKAIIESGEIEALERELEGL